MAYKSKYNDLMKMFEDKQDFMRRSRERANQARREYRERSSGHTTPIGYALRRVQRQAAYGRSRSNLNPENGPLKSREGINSYVTRGLANSRAKYTRNTGNTSYEAVKKRSEQEAEIKRQKAWIAEQAGKYDDERNNTAKIKEYNRRQKVRQDAEAQAKRDVAAHAGVYDDERNNTEKIKRYHATHGGPAPKQERVKVHSGGGVSAVDTPRYGAASIAGAALGAGGGAAHGAVTAKMGNGASAVKGLLSGRYWGRNANRAKSLIKAGAKSGVAKGAMRGLIPALVMEAGQWIVNQRMNPKNIKRDNEAAHQRDEYERKRRYLNNGWDGGAR